MLNYLFTQTPLTFLTQSFWRDEAFSFLLAKKNVVEIISLSFRDFNPPLYYLFLHFWLKIFGPSEISLRSFSFIFYWLTIYVVFLFLTEILKISIKKNSLFISFYLLLFITNPFLSYYAFEARNYALFAFFASLSFYTFYRKNYKVYFFSTLLGLFTHYFMLFVVLSQLFFNYLVNRKGRQFQITNKILLKPLFIFLPWLFLTLVKNNFFASSFWIEQISLKSVVDLLGIIYTGYDGRFRQYSQSITWISLAILTLLVILFKKRDKKYNSDNQLLLYLGLWGIGVPYFIILLSLLKPVFFPRYFIFSTVGLLLFIIYILERTRVEFRIIGLILLFTVALTYQKIQIQHYKKRDFNRVIKEIKVLAKKDDLLYVTSELDFFTAKYYFPAGKIYIFSKSYEQIPNFVGKVLISESDIAHSLPLYPKKAFVLKPDGSYIIQALY